MSYLTHTALFLIGFGAGWYARRVLLYYRGRKRLAKIADLYEAARLRLERQPPPPRTVDVMCVRDGMVSVEKADVTIDSGEDWDARRWVPGGRS